MCRIPLHGLERDEAASGPCGIPGKEDGRRHAAAKGDYFQFEYRKRAGGHRKRAAGLRGRGGELSPRRSGPKTWRRNRKACRSIYGTGLSVMVPKILLRSVGE